MIKRERDGLIYAAQEALQETRVFPLAVPSSGGVGNQSALLNAKEFSGGWEGTSCAVPKILLDCRQ